jgi:insertion element IS1 protein InsB
LALFALAGVEKKGPTLTPVNTALRRPLHPNDVTVGITRVEAAEVDAMWSYVGTKQRPRWLWPAIDHWSGAVLAYVFGRRQDEGFLQLKALLAPCGITRFFTDHWGAYARHLALDTHVPGKRATQQIERKHLTWRTRIKRLARKTICFSKSIERHDIVIGLFVNRYEFGLRV